MDRMSPLDASFLHVENENNHMHIASVAIFEGPPPRYVEIEEMVASKLHLVPRYRQLVRFVPLELGRPVWADDPHFSLRYHIRHSSIPGPGSDEQLRHLVGRVMGQQLDRARPLWEIWVVEGLEADRWAILSKTHHCMVDGVSGSDLLTVVMDSAPDMLREPAPPWEPEPLPSGGDLIADAVRERLTSANEMLRGVRSAVRGPRRLRDRLSELATGAGSLGKLASSVDVGLNGPIGPHRRWDWARTTLADVKKVRVGLGGTVNVYAEDGRIDEATGGSTSSLTEEEAIDALPGVAAQESVFNQIISLTVLIAIIVVALFFALITVERIGLYGVLKALGAGSGRLFAGVLLQAVIVTLIACGSGALAAVALDTVLPVGSIPFIATGSRLVGSTFFLLVAAVIGCAFSLRRVLRVDPATAMGGAR